MDQDTRHWYLQQMGIPVWVPKDAADAALPEIVAETAAIAETTAVKTAAEVAEAPVAKTAAVEPAARQTESQASSSTSSPAPASAPASPSTPASQSATIWLVMPNVAASERAAAQELLGKILAAVAVSADSCELIWGLPDAMPSADVKWVWCFGVQAPPGLAAKTLSLPGLADMLANVAAKKQAWGTLKSAMPFA